MAKTIYALLVGINEYDPSSKVKKLRGCVSDMQKIQALLLTEYDCSPNNIKTLENKQATREAILTTFQEHLCRNPVIKENDLVLFYFSGHGSYARTAVEFERYDAQKYDETLVCYDSRNPNGEHYDLADKEIAVLLNKVKPNVEIVVIVDACHSDSITRSAVDEVEEGLLEKYVSKRKTPRDLSSYLLRDDDFYSNQQKVVIPKRPHIAFSACTREQKAWEKFGQGVFTREFLKMLRESKRNISYRLLYELTCSAVRKSVTNQTPQIFVPNNFNINKVFLKDTTIQDVPPLLIEYINNNWCLNHGAIYGLKTDKKSVNALQIAVYQETDGKFKHLENIPVKAVKLKEAHLQPEFFKKLQEEKLAILPRSATKKQKEPTTYHARIISAIPNLSIYLNGTEADQQAFLKELDSKKIPFISFDTTLINATYELVFAKDQLLIKKIKPNQFIHGCLGRGVDAITYIIEKLQQIEEWERIAKLDNSNTQLNRSKVEVQFLEESRAYYFEPPVIHLNGTDDGVLFQIRAKNLSDKDLYIGLIHLSPQFGIESFYECEKFPANNTDWITLDNQHVLEFGKKQTHSVTDIFKVIVSTEPFDDYYFSQKSMLLGEVVEPDTFRDARLRSDKRPPESDWFTHTITTHLTKLDTSLNTENISLNKNITIKGHPSFNAKVSLAAINASTKEIHPAHYISEAFSDLPFELIDLSPYPIPNEFSDQTIIYLNDIENEDHLTSEPLEIKVEKDFLDKDYIIPITFDGEFFLPLGISKKDKEGNTIISLQNLPTIEEPFIHEQTRSTKRALWFCLLKFTPYKEAIFRLRYIWKYEQRQPIYGKLSTSEIKNKVAQADKILLLIHGITGNTETMAQAVQSLFETGKYAMILTFDYENLHTEIEQIAEKLDSQLEEIGLGRNSQRTIDVVAHSMGGLVIRYLIEGIRKQQRLVDKLLLFGTPNGGSRFSELTKYRDISLVALTLAANSAEYLLPTFTPWLYTAEGIIGSTSVISRTLEQMHPESNFIKRLYFNEPAPKTKYFLIAGNIQKYQPDGNWWHRFKENIEVKKYQWVYEDTPSDLIVSKSQITHIPASFNAEIIEVGCYHMNYFTEQKSIDVLINILG